MESIWLKFVRQFALRVLIAAPIFYYSSTIAYRSQGDAFVAVGLLVVVGLIIAPPFAELFSNCMGGFYLPSERASKPILSYARADLYIRTEKYQEAAEEFDAILKYYPQEIQALIGKLCLMVQFAQKNDKATALYYSNLKRLSDGGSHKKLVEAYAMILAKKDVIVRKPSDLVYFTIYLSEQMPAFRSPLPFK